jgi:hypothetical protein
VVRVLEKEEVGAGCATYGLLGLTVYFMEEERE